MEKLHIMKIINYFLINRITFSKYVISGFISLFVNYLVTTFLNYFIEYRLIPLIIGFMMGLVTSGLLHSKYTFQTHFNLLILVKIFNLKIL